VALSLVILGPFLAGSAAPVEASSTITIDGVLPDGGDCASVGVWNAGSTTCDVVDLSLSRGDVLTIASGRLWIHGMLHSRGARIENSDRLRITELYNTGTVRNHAGALLETWWEAGAAQPQLENHGTIVNEGDFSHWDGALYNGPAGLLRGSGRITQYGSLGSFRNSGTVLIEGLWFPVEHAFENLADGTLIIADGASVFAELHGRIINHGRIDVYDSLYGFNWRMDNYGTVYNHVNISTCDDTQLTTIRNYGTFYQLGTFSNCGTVENHGTFVNSGSMADYYRDPGVLENSGTVVDCGSITCPVTGMPVVPDADGDGDGFCDLADCAVGDATVWGVPDAARALRLSHDGGTGGVTTLDWISPMYPGGNSPRYDVVSSADPADFVSGPLAGCVETDDGADTTAIDPVTPWPPHPVSHFLVRPGNLCGEGSSGFTSAGEPRTLRVCP
jgi:hypothetical protein